jgi:hypothetical protein
MKPRSGAAIALAAFFVVAAVLLVVGVRLGLPTRWWVVDDGALALAALMLGGAAGFVTHARWSRRVAQAACIVALSAGLLVISLLSVTVGTIRGFYGPIGQGGALVFALVIALVVPYLVVTPILGLLHLHARAGEPS